LIEREIADVIIVGSGLTGAAFARSIGDEWPTARILMIEAGPQVSMPPGSHVFNIHDAMLRSGAEIDSQGPLRGIAYEPITRAEWSQRIAGAPDSAMLRRPGLFAVGHGGPDGYGFPAAQAASNVGGMGAHWFGGCPRPAVGERVPFIEAQIMNAALDDAGAMLRSSSGQYPDSPIAPTLERKLGDLFNPGRSNRAAHAHGFGSHKSGRGQDRYGRHPRRSARRTERSFRASRKLDLPADPPRR
jgi:hypothetical protein